LSKSTGGAEKNRTDDQTFITSGCDVSADGQRSLSIRLAKDLPDMPIAVVLNWWAEFAKRQN
jgi:hypothetical protein